MFVGTGLRCERSGGWVCSVGRGWGGGGGCVCTPAAGGGRANMAGQRHSDGPVHPGFQPGHVQVLQYNGHTANLVEGVGGLGWD